MDIVAAVLIAIAGIVNLLPIAGALSGDRLHALYGLPLGDANLVILMRHRAVLFGIVGGLLLTAVFVDELRPFAIVAGLLSMMSFVLIARIEGDYNDRLRRILMIDLVASIGLAAAGVIELL